MLWALASKSLQRVSYAQMSNAPLPSNIIEFESTYDTTGVYFIYGMESRAAVTDGQSLQTHYLDQLNDPSQQLRKSYAHKTWLPGLFLQ